MPSEVSEILPAGRTGLLLDGLGIALNDWGIASYGGSYDPMPVRPIFLGPDEPATAPDERLILTPATGYNESHTTTVLPIGFNYRGPVDGSKTAALNFLDLLERRLQNLAHYQFGQIMIGRVWRQSSGLIGKDSRRRHGGSATYLFRGKSPSVNS